MYSQNQLHPNDDASAEFDDGGCVYDPTTSTADCESSVTLDSYSYPVVDSAGLPKTLGRTSSKMGLKSLTKTGAASPTWQIRNNCGHLYDGFAATSTINGGICPTGWHVPTKLDWIEMESFLFAAGHGERMGAALKSNEKWSVTGCSVRCIED
jgi:hypothetical protein